MDDVKISFKVEKFPVFHKALLSIMYDTVGMNMWVNMSLFLSKGKLCMVKALE